MAETTDSRVSVVKRLTRTYRRRQPWYDAVHKPLQFLNCVLFRVIHHLQKLRQSQQCFAISLND